MLISSLVGCGGSNNSNEQTPTLASPLTEDEAKALAISYVDNSNGFGRITDVKEYGLTDTDSYHFGISYTRKQYIASDESEENSMDVFVSKYTGQVWSSSIRVR